MRTWVVFSRISCIGCARTIDHGFGLVACVDAKSYQRNNKRIKEYSNSIACRVSTFATPTIILMGSLPSATPVSAASVVSRLTGTLGDVFCRRQSAPSQ